MAPTFRSTRLRLSMVLPKSLRPSVSREIDGQCPRRRPSQNLRRIGQNPSVGRSNPPRRKLTYALLIRPLGFNVIFAFRITASVYSVDGTSEALHLFFSLSHPNIRQPMNFR